MLEPQLDGSPHTLSDCLVRLAVLHDQVRLGQVEMDRSGHDALQYSLQRCAEIARSLEHWRLAQMTLMRALLEREHQLLLRLAELEGNSPGNVVAFAPRRRLPPAALYQPGDRP